MAYVGIGVSQTQKNRDSDPVESGWIVVWMHDI